eukprot:TRINITY_DN1256_c0_g1_i1.p1 TRINITY_DN1256_c0_g1~~TRINITY_DN1256_c0_g1_i1.p1  ORF type:complete len:143 (-),score=34.57 TRINITY_DN1256_c0_g1_i1:330-758(-)
MEIERYLKWMGVNCCLEIMDTTSRNQQFVAIKDLYLKEGQGFILAYSIISRKSFNYLQEIREEIIKVKATDQFPLVLIGNMVDLEDERMVMKEEGQNLAKEWNCSFFECSAKTRENIEELFYDLIQQILKMENDYKKKENKG